MRWVETTGRTVEEAVSAALARLGVDRRHAEVEVLEEPSRGLFGILGQREARVRVTARQTKADFAREFLEQVARRLGADVTVRARETQAGLEVTVDGRDVGLLIGRRGSTLNAIQYLLNVAAGRVTDDRTPIVLDVAGYRQRRTETLERIARRAAERARRTGRRVVLEPMSAAERRIVHMAVQSVGGVVTASEGEEPFRRVVVLPQTGATRRAGGGR